MTVLTARSKGLLRHTARWVTSHRMVLLTWGARRTLARSGRLSGTPLKHYTAMTRQSKTHTWLREIPSAQPWSPQWTIQRMRMVIPRANHRSKIQMTAAEIKMDVTALMN